MLDAAETLLVLDICMVPGRLDEVKDLNIGLDICQQSLNEYLKTKRTVFPRFNFISTEELLTVLGGSDCYCIQNYVAKLFKNVQSIILKQQPSGAIYARGLISCEEETLYFKNNILIEGKIEHWMAEILHEMQMTVKFLVKKAIFDYGKVKELSRTDWIIRFHGMVAMAASSVWWTAEVEEVFLKIQQGNKRAMKEYLGKQNKQIEELAKKIREELPPNDRIKFKTFVITDVHARDVIERFVRDSVLDVNAFGWDSQLRYNKFKQDSIVGLMILILDFTG